MLLLVYNFLTHTHTKKQKQNEVVQALLITYMHSDYLGYYFYLQPYFRILMHSFQKPFLK